MMAMSKIAMVLLVVVGVLPSLTLSQVVAKVNTNEPEEAQQEAEEDVMKKLEKWLAVVEADGVNEKCAHLAGEFGHNASAVVLAGAECVVDDSHDFSFSGKLDADGYPDGPGVLKVGGKFKGGKKRGCLKLGKVFGSQAEEVDGTFHLGTLAGKAVLKWPEEGLRAELLLKEGVPHGAFKVTAKSRMHEVWSYGVFKNGTIASDCWVITKEQIRYGQCDDAFVFRTDTKTTIVPRRRSEDSVSSYSIPVRGSLKGEQLVDARDAVLTAIHGFENCSRHLMVATHRAQFVYDLRSGERKFKLHKPDKLCRIAKSRKESALALRDYFGSIKLDKVLGYPPDPTKMDVKKSKKLLSNVDLISPERYEATLNFFTVRSVEFQYFGGRDEEGSFEGYAELRFVNKVTCLRGHCHPTEYSRLAGHFVAGVLQGPVTLATVGSRQTYGFVVTDGVVHGLVASIGVELLYSAAPTRVLKSQTSFDYSSVEPGFVGSFVGGKPRGKVWRGMIGDAIGYSGMLYGQVKDESRNVSGEDAAYLYPWYESALVGNFEDNVMKEATYAHVTGVTCQNNVAIPHFTKEDSEVFRFDPATNESVSSQPLLQDPYEEENVVVKPSTIHNAGEGLFAKRGLKKGQLVALYAGLIFDPGQMKLYEPFCNKIVNESNPCDKYALGTHRGDTILIPSPMDSTENYRATLAWKANNGYDSDAHVYFHDIEHPRFGLVAAVSAQKDIEEGEEILVDYQYVGEMPESDQQLTGIELGRMHHKWYFEGKKTRAAAKLQQEQEAAAAAAKKD